MPALGTDELLDGSSNGLDVICPLQRRSQLIPMPFQVRGDLDEATFLSQEVAEVQRPLLPGFEPGGQQRQHGLAENARFYLGARVETDDGSAVIERVVKRLIRVQYPRERERDATVPADVDIEAELGAHCGSTAAIVDQSDGRFVLRLSGPDVRRTLAKGVTIDLHPRAFSVGETALTQLSHLGVQLTLRDAAPTFDLVAPRPGAGDIWDWLCASAAQFGLEVEMPDTGA